MRHLWMLMSVLAALAGCAAVDVKDLSDNELAQRIARTFNTTSEQIVISDRHYFEQTGGLIFGATVQGKKHACIVKPILFGSKVSPAFCMCDSNSGKREISQFCLLPANE